MQIKYLFREGMQPAKIARRLGVSRQTVYNHIGRGPDEPFPKPRAKRPSKLDPHKDYIRAQLERFDLTCPRLLTEIRAQGYEGGMTILRDFVRPLKEEFVRRVTERFETLPGMQAQIAGASAGVSMWAGSAESSTFS